MLHPCCCRTKLSPIPTFFSPFLFFFLVYGIDLFISGMHTCPPISTSHNLQIAFLSFVWLFRVLRNMHHHAFLSSKNLTFLLYTAFWKNTKDKHSTIFLIVKHAHKSSPICFKLKFERYKQVIQNAIQVFQQLSLQIEFPSLVQAW